MSKLKVDNFYQFLNVFDILIYNCKVNYLKYNYIEYFLFDIIFNLFYNMDN